jgi:phenol 2-monooxygenase
MAINTTETRVDVLIVGAGPGALDFSIKLLMDPTDMICIHSAGLMLATQLSKLKLHVKIVDKAAHPVLRGHADGASGFFTLCYRRA